MKIALGLLKWAAGFSLRQYAEAAVVAAIFAFVMYWDHLEIQKGRDETEARYAAINAKAQAAIEIGRASCRERV